MKVILKQDITGVGRKYEVKNVSDGFASNFLFPRKLATVATESELKKIEKEKAKADSERQVMESLMDKNLESLKGVKIILKAKASETGHLFAGIHKTDVANALNNQAKISIPEENLEVPKNIKSVGTYSIPVNFKDKKGEFELVVEGE